jgi:hypothetical protein
MTLYRKLRMRFGMTWGIRPAKVLEFALMVACIVALVLLFGWMQERDTANNLAAEAQSAKEALQPAFQILTQCLKGGDNPIAIGNELWMCGAANTGVKL